MQRLGIKSGIHTGACESHFNWQVIPTCPFDLPALYFLNIMLVAITPLSLCTLQAVICVFFAFSWGKNVLHAQAKLAICTIDNAEKGRGLVAFWLCSKPWQQQQFLLALHMNKDTVTPCGLIVWCAWYSTWCSACHINFKWLNEDISNVTCLIFLFSLTFAVCSFFTLKPPLLHPSLIYSLSFPIVPVAMGTEAGREAIRENLSLCNLL